MQEVLDKLKNDIAVAKTKEILLCIFKKAVQLELKCFESEDREIREIGYKAQDLQFIIENKL